MKALAVGVALIPPSNLELSNTNLPPLTALVSRYEPAASPPPLFAELTPPTSMKVSYEPPADKAPAKGNKGKGSEETQNPDLTKIDDNFKEIRTGDVVKALTSRRGKPDHKACQEYVEAALAVYRTKKAIADLPPTSASEKSLKQLTADLAKVSELLADAEKGVPKGSPVRDPIDKILKLGDEYAKIAADAKKLPTEVKPPVVAQIAGTKDEIATAIKSAENARVNAKASMYKELGLLQYSNKDAHAGCKAVLDAAVTYGQLSDLYLQLPPNAFKADRDKWQAKVDQALNDFNAALKKAPSGCDSVLRPAIEHVQATNTIFTNKAGLVAASGTK